MAHDYPGVTDSDASDATLTECKFDVGGVVSITGRGGGATGDVIFVKSPGMLKKLEKSLIYTSRGVMGLLREQILACGSDGDGDGDVTRICRRCPRPGRTRCVKLPALINQFHTCHVYRGRRGVGGGEGGGRKKLNGRFFFLFF